MDLYFKQHKSNLEIYVAPTCPHETYEYAKSFLQHYRPYSIGIDSYRDLDEFKRVALLHGHTIIVEDLREK